jgi:hypothetical protein
MSWLNGTVADGADFALCLTHDVDRPYKTYQSLYYALTDRNPRHLLDLWPGRNPYWTFERVMDIETSLGVRSSWYFLDEQSLFADRPTADLADPTAWQLYAGRYSLSDADVREVIRKLDAEGWEVGLHGSYESYRDATMLASEKSRIEEILGHEILGARQHYLNCERPDTWIRQRAVGLQYDATPGSRDTYGFQGRYEPFRPFDDEFVVFPVTVMEQTLPDPETQPDRAWSVCASLLAEARENEAAMSILWHPRYFSDDYAGYERLYRRLIERALEMNAWVGPIGDLYASMDHPSVAEAQSTPRRG